MERIRLADDVVYRSFGAETVLLNLETGQYHGLRGSGGRMLEVLEQTGDVSETARIVAEEAGQPQDLVMQDLTELCDALLERSLLVRETEGGTEARERGASA